MSTTYKPRHKRKSSIYGDASRGPARWVRAAANAMAKPNSAAGQLFFGRASRAYRLAADYPDLVGAPYGHWKWDYDMFARERLYERFEYYTCSLFCCAMVTQLDKGINDYVSLVFHLENDDDAPTSARPKRTARCQFCGTDIKP